MSEDSNTEQVEEMNDESRVVVITVDFERANEILQSFEVRMPDASELDEIRLVITGKRNF